MMAVLLILSIVLSVCKSAVYNCYAKSEMPDLPGIFRFNAVSYGIAALITLCFGIGESLSFSTVICSAAYAVTVFSFQALSVAAMTVGSMSLTSLLALYGMVIPSAAGPIFWNEPFGVSQLLGMVIMILSLWMLRGKDDNKSSSEKKWRIMAGFCFVMSGLAGLIEKIHQSTNGREERRMFLLFAFLMMFIFSVLGSVTVKTKLHKNISVKPIIMFGAISGAIISIFSRINLTLAGKLDSLIYYPIANGGALLLTVFISAAVFREKLHPKRLLGFFMGLCAIFLLSLPTL